MNKFKSQQSSYALRYRIMFYKVETFFECNKEIFPHRFIGFPLCGVGNSSFLSCLTQGKVMRNGLWKYFRSQCRLSDKTNNNSIYCLTSIYFQFISFKFDAIVLPRRVDIMISEAMIMHALPTSMKQIHGSDSVPHWGPFVATMY